jgi:endonuclease/exonuclease/phosphatase family metal-dependent hydrolase
MSRRTRRVVWVLSALGLLAALFVGLFALNGLALADRQAPRMRHFADVPVAPTKSAPGEVTFVSYNIAKCFAAKAGPKFDSRANVEGRLRRIAELIRAEQPDAVFLSEAVTELPPCDVDQVAFLARECGLPFVAFGENYNFGIPFVRAVGGNAILSRTPLQPVANIDLAGRKPFWVTKNNRRALFASAERGGTSVLLASLHNDSFDMRNNEAQMRQLLEYVGDRPAVLAGDFNNRPNDGSIRMLRGSGKFAGEFDGAPTFFEGTRAERIDYIFVPVGWELIESRVIADDTSDHHPLVCRFKVK